MRKHNGMRPQDVVLLLKISILPANAWHGKDLARALHLSPAEVSDSLRRCQYARLLQEGSRTVVRPALLHFLLCGLPYVFPAHPGTLVRGLPTAYGAEPQRWQLPGYVQPHVWPEESGPAWGAAVEPLYAGATLAARQDPALHRLLALTDILRLALPAQRSAVEQELVRQLQNDIRG